MALTRISSAGIQTSPTFSGDVRIGLGATLESTGNAYVTGVTTLGIGATGDVYLYNPANSALSGTENSVYGWKAKTFCGGLQVNSAICLSRGGTNGLSLSYNNATGGHITQSVGFLQISAVGGPDIRMNAYGHCFKNPNNVTFLTINKDNDKAVDLYYNNSQRLATTNEGILVSGGATITGNLSIGGTVTYEDVTNVDSIGIITARSSINVADSIIHEGDTDTKIDFATNQIKFTAANRLRIDLAANHFNYLYGTQLIEADSTHTKPSGSTYVARFRDTTGDDTEVQYFNTNVTNTIISWNDTGNTTSAGNLIFKSVTGGTGIEHGRFTGTGSFNLAKDFSVAGVSTLSGQLNVHGNIRIGSNEKYRLYDNSGTNRFDTYNQTIQFVNKGDDGSISPTIAKFIPEGAVELYYGTGGAASVKRFETSATGVILSSTDAGSSAEPELVLYRNSASPADADYLGQIKFNGKSDTGTQRTYAKITGKILDASNGTEDGIIEFAHRKAGSQTITGRWRSDSLQLLNGTNLTVNGDILLDQGSKVGFSTDSNTFIGQDNLDRLDFNVGGKRLVSINEGTNQPVLIIDKDGVNTGPGNSGANYNANPHGTELVLGNTSSNNHGLTIVSPSDSYGVVLFSDGSGGGLDATRGSITFTHSDNKLSLKSKIGSVVLNHKDSEQLSTTDTGVCIGILTGNTVRYRGYCGDMDSNFLAGEGAGIGITDHCNNTAFYNVLIGRETAKRLNTGCDNIIIGRNTFQTATKGCKNVIIGTRNAISFNGTDNPQNNVFIGHCVAYQMSGNMNHNVAMGSCASFAGCTGSGVAIGQNAGYGVQGQINYNNVFLGNHAGYAISTGGNNVAAGPSAGQNLYKGCLNVYLGSSAGFNQLNGGCNVAIGCGAMYGFSSNEVSVHNNVAIGVHAGFSLSTGNHGIYIGSGAGCKVTSGPANIAMGLGAMKCTTTGSYNVALNAGTRITTGSINVAIGNASGYCIGTCGCNVYIGNQAGYIGGSSFNIAIGDKAGYRLGGDIGGSDAGNRGGGNIIFGQCSGIELRCGGQNFFVGFHAGACSRETTCTIAIGRGAGSSDTRGFDNVYIGNHAGNGCACGGTSCHNVVIGSQAMYKIFDGSCNVAIGNCAAYCNINGKWNLALGNMAGFYNTTGCHNISLGYLAGHLNNNASDAISIGQYANYCNKGGANIAIGRKSSFHDDVESNNFNVAIGDCAFMGGTNMGTRKHNVAIGILAGGVSTAGSGNVFIGCYSGYCNAASTNVYINRKAGYFNKTGHDNVMIGDCAGFCGGDQNRNVFIGKQAGYCNNGDDNIAIGLKAGCCLSSGEKNIAIGSGAGQRFKSGSNNIAFGFQVMTLADVNGSNNIAMGNYTGRRIATGQGNIFFGGGAGRYVLGGSCNVAIGINAHYCLSGGNCNIAIGQNAGSKQTSSDQNVSIGHLAGSQNCTGSGNVAVGHSAGYGIRGANNVSIGATAGPADSCIDTYDNVFIGSRTGTAYTSGCNIIAIGINAGASSCCAATGCNNIHIGQNTGCKTQSGNNNITIGCRAGRNLTTGGCNIFMGLYAGGTVSTASGIVAIGNRTAQNATNAVIAIGCCAGGQFGGGSAGGIFIGRCAGRYANSSDSSNIIMGGNAGRSLTNGLNIIIGSGAAYPATTACRNLSFGGQSNQQLTTGDGNLAFGTFSLTGNTTGCCNIAIGDRSGAANVGATGSCNVTISVGSGHSLTTGSDNVFVGRCAGYGVTSGYKNISIGLCAGYGHGNHNVAGVGFGTDNVFIGSCAGRCVATASRNVFIGREAGQRINDGCYNVAIGDQAGCCMMSGSSNTVVGSFAAYHLCSGSSNTYLGLQAALCATTGSQNTIIGNTAGKTMTTGGSNVAVGHFAGCTLGSGGGNVMMGNCAGYRSSGSHNVMLGHSSGWDRLGSKFKYNTLVGSHAGYARGTQPDGAFDVLIGFYAGACYTGTCSIGIGHSVRIPITDGSNQLAIGQLNDYWITGTCDYNVGIGTTRPIAKLDVNVGSSVSAFNIEGSEGQLFSVTNNLSSGSIFAVNDITGLPSIDVDADGTIQLAPRGTSEFVGVGTTAPTSKLHVQGTTYFSGPVGINSFIPAATLDIHDLGSTGPCLLLRGGSTTEGDIVVPDGEAIGFGNWNYESSTYTERVRFASDGDVGISTSSPRTRLHVSGPIHTDRFFSNPTSLDTSITFPESGGAVNGGVFGPYTIASGVTLTIASGSTFKVL